MRKLVAGLLGVCWSGSSAAVADLLVQQPRQNSPAFTAAVARVGKPIKVVIGRGERLSDELIRVCGGIDPTYVSLMVARNPHLSGWSAATVFDKQTPVELPACARMPESTTAEIKQNASIAKITKDLSVKFHPAGFQDIPENTTVFDPTTSTKVMFDTVNAQSASDVRFTTASSFPTAAAVAVDSAKWKNASGAFFGAQNAEQIAVLNDLISLNKLTVGRNLTIPAARPVWSQISLSDAVTDSQAKTIIEAALTTDNASPTNVIDAAPASIIGPKATMECSTTPGPAWPFDRDAIIKQLALNATRIEGGPLRRQTILIADTGFDFFGTARREFPIKTLKKIRPLAKALGTDPGGTAQAFDVDGVNLASRRNEIATAPNYAFRYHGLGVAGTALGTRLLEPERTLMDFPIQIAFASVVDSTARGAAIPATMLSDVIDYLRNENSITVVNASLTVAKRIPGLESSLRAIAPRVVVVVAAGNGGVKLDNQESWPAMFGGNPANAPGAAVITVGSHEPNGAIDKESNWHGTRVDLLAPGCAIPSYSADAQSHLFNFDWAGTSFAAPLVSFTAAWLGAYGLSVAEIKARMLLSASVRDDLNDVVYSRGLLNMPRALAYDFNSYEVAEKDHIRRVLSASKSEHAMVRLCGRDYQLRKIAKAARDERQKSRVWHIWLKSTDSEHPEVPDQLPLCEQKEGDKFTVSVLDYVTGKAFEIQLDRMFDYTAAVRE